VELLRFSEIREPAALETVPRVKAKYDAGRVWRYLTRGGLFGDYFELNG